MIMKNLPLQILGKNVLGKVSIYMPYFVEWCTMLADED